MKIRKTRKTWVTVPAGPTLCLLPQVTDVATGEYRSDLIGYIDGEIVVPWRVR
jgi:hypothetical protein